MTRVLIVDDTPDMARLMAMAVEVQGYEVSVAGNGQIALQLAAANPPDVILLDIMMPRMSGIEVLRHLKQDAALSVIPVILVTARSDDHDIIVGLDAGAQDYVTKPFKREILAARVRSAVRLKQDHDSLLRINKQLQAEIKERERVQRELAQAKRLESVGHLAAGIAHEINTPAQYVGDNIRFLQEAFADVEKLWDCLDHFLEVAQCGTVTAEILAEVESAVRAADVDFLADEVPKAIGQSLEGIERVANIVRAMKEFSHPGNGNKQRVDLNQAIRSTLTVARSEWKYVAELVTDFDTDLPLVPCLPGDFNQVILNLVINAAQAIAAVVKDNSTGKGTLSVRTRREGDWAEIRIADTGSGIPEDIQDAVFDHFFTTKEVGQGTGQGLTIARSIVVEKHGGTIAFESQVGQGTTFVIRLPITDPTEGNPQRQWQPVEAGV